MAVPSDLTTARCQELAWATELLLEKLGLQVEPNSDLGLFVSEMKWLGGFTDVWNDAARQDEKRTVQAFLYSEQAEHIVSAIGKAWHVEGLRNKVRHLCRNKLDRVIRRGPGLEALFEIEVAAFASKLNLNVAFAEPDIILTNSDGLRNGIACKRPSRHSTVKRNIKHAAQQISKCGLPSYILLGLDGLLLGSIKAVESQLQLQNFGDAELDRILSANLDAIHAAFGEDGAGKGRVGGIIACSRFVSWVSSPSSVCWSLRARQVPNLSLPGAAAGLDALARVLTK